MYSTSEANDDAEEVNEFLKRVRELGERRDREDAERTKKLEEEILQGRIEREARRQERARSLSPDKASASPQSIRSYVNTPVKSPLSSSFASPLAHPSSMMPPQLSPTREVDASGTLDRLTSKGMASRPSMAATGVNGSPTRSGTLSWQRRPLPLNSGATRPSSALASERQPFGSSADVSQSATSDDQAAPLMRDSPLTRSQIAQSLGSKEPAWFRQTADRGIRSAALRRDQIPELQSSEASRTRPLAGLPRGDETASARSTSPTESARSRASRMGPVRGSFASRHTAQSSFSSFGTRDSTILLPGEEVQIMNPTFDAGSSLGNSDTNERRNLGISPGPEPTSPERIERPASPTKGLGGFVQSAMLKRSDSANKRWSAQPLSSLGRQNSILGTRGGAASLTSSMSMPKLDSSVESNESFGATLSRPSSRNSNSTVTDSVTGAHRATSRASHHTRAKSASTVSARERIDEEAGDMSSPPSPSKWFDPSKSSWLETALNKPDSSKPKTTPPLPQPSWMAEITKAKQQRDSPSSVTPKEPTRQPAPEIPVKPRNFSPRLSLQKQTLEEIKIAEDEASSDITASQPRSEPKEELPQDTNSPNPKPKPNTPPKKDFRNTLKPRQPPAGTNHQEEPEFKAMFGKLKRTRTEKYVAPDDLRNNILRGKAGLSLAASPQRPDRRDELKESLLKKKESMRMKQADSFERVKGPPTAGATGSVKEIPEGTSRRHALRELSGSSPVPEFQDKHVSMSAEKSQRRVELADPPIPNDSPRPTALGAKSRPASDHDEVKGLVLPSQQQGAEVFHGKTTVESKLGSRINPVLDKVLARGQGSMPTISSSRPFTPTDSVTDDSSKTLLNPKSSVTASEQLTHMTKSRARGPKRRAPNAKDETNKSTSAQTSEISGAQLVRDLEVLPSSRSRLVDVAPIKEVARHASTKPAFASEAVQIKYSDQVPNAQSGPTRPPRATETVDSASPRKSAPAPTVDVEKPKPQTPAKSPSLKLTSPPLQQKPRFDYAVKPTMSAITSEKPSHPLPVPELTHHLPSGVQNPEQSTSVRGAAALWGKSQNPPAVGQLPKSPIKLPTRQDEPVGLGLSFTSDPMSPPMTMGPPPKAVDLPGASATPSSFTKSTKPNGQHLDPRTTEVGSLFGNFFGDMSIADSTSPDIDTHHILTSKPDESKVKTLRKTIQEIGNDGKSLLDVPPHQEYIVFSNSMYLCTHVFGGISGRVTEVYLWAGNGVQEPALEDAHRFARSRAPKDSKLFVFRQGKEISNFFQALGGIVITRQGSRSLETLTEYVLCARRHLGHVAFDEVDFSPHLCAGFPYLVYAKSGKVYLWKGVGCNADEIGCARLIGMDLSVTGEIVEVEQGSEPSDFLDLFPPLGPKQLRTIPRSAEHWRLKAKHDSYCVRLYRVDQQQQAPRHQQQRGVSPSKVSSFLWPLVRRPSQLDARTNHSAQITISEIAPFCQTDLEPENTYVLDAFFEIYIIVGPLATSKFPAFVAALSFTTDYGILAASLEDRPFVPVSTVVMEGVPRDMKACFRGWRDDLVNTGALMAGSRGMGLGRGGSLRVVSLGAAVEGVRGLQGR